MSLKSDVWQTYFLLAYVAPEAITESMIDPLIPYMIRTFSVDVAPDQLEAAVGGRAGLMGGMFYLPLLIMNILWGTLSDIVGRKPILIIGLFFSALTTFLLGINTSSFAFALVCRFLAGVFGSNSTVAKGALGEIHLDEKGRSWAYSLYGSLYAFSGIVGPLIGGVLVSSGTEDAPLRYPYFKACALGAGLCVLALPITHVYFFEPKELRHAKLEDMPSSPTSKSLLVRDLFSVKGLMQLWGSLKEPMTGKVMFPIFLYVLIAFCNRAWTTLLPLLFSAKHDLGGLAFTAFDTSFAMTVMACCKLFFQTTICQAIVTRFGMNGSYCLGMAVIIPACALLVCWVDLAGMDGVMLGFAVHGSVWVCEAIVYLSVIMMISDSVSPSGLGAAHGLSATCAAASRVIAPPLVGYVWEYVAVRARMPWTAFFVVQVAAVGAILFARWGNKEEAGEKGVYRRVREDVEMRSLDE
ncbi:MFS general substrate transporter [Rhizoclosmatium globosum]|uniref:MFS general substrate transporter n=1 Tax=Rhizoclosmatium globosum TaxID=329046 RepID=A0A1Y2CVX6_9FUNG|nr:MFS general substrate transporter [Rhizoclosmatium globosum]|eukprot:ORY51127.1 MFS general substrate transporter [Rhizoclosmatium globosum]